MHCFVLLISAEQLTPQLKICLFCLNQRYLTEFSCSDCFLLALSPQKHHPYCRKLLVSNVKQPNVIWLIGRPGMASVNIEQPNAAVSNNWDQTLYG